jgi:uncharacterized protein YjcR
MTTSVELRLRALELQLGLPDDSSSIKTLQERLNRLEESYEKITPAPLRQLWKESEKLFEELDPGTALTHQQQIVAPILYRKQELLALADDFHNQMRAVEQISQFLLLNHSKPPTEGEQWTEDQVLQAPILTIGADSHEKDYQQRLEALVESILDVRKRTEASSSRLDRMLDNYQDLVVALSEKMLLADELLCQREQEKKQDV